MTKRIILTVCQAAVAFGLITSTASADLVFRFAFENDAGGNVSGPIEGLFTVLDNAAGQAATDVVLTNTGGHTLVPGFTDEVSGNWPVSVNIFDVVNGTITDAAFSAFNFVGSDIYVVSFQTSLFTTEAFAHTDNATFSRTTIGSNVTFSPVSVPEPGSLGMIALAGAGLFAVRHPRRRT